MSSEEKNLKNKKSAESSKSQVQALDKKEKTDSKKEEENESKEAVKLNGLFAFKMSMSTFYNEKGESIPVTALKYEKSFVSQIKTKDKDSYSAIQMAFKAQKNKRCSKAIIQHLKPAGFKEGARFIKELKQDVVENVQVGREISIDSLQKGDLVKVSSFSKGKGFTGVMKRWNFRGGRASHGSKAHRRTGSIGQHTEPARVFPGRKMPGRHGFKKVSLLKVPVVEVFSEEGIIFVKGPVPGARNTLVSIQKI
ncbi:MAG: 50S ribosomal protein L3 [Bdellovibrionales bacterium]|nr:50S ribosomal protein L3 [Bdellovibrionales bacterium]